MIPINRPLNNPEPNEPVRNLKFIGPLFSGRLRRQYRINTLRQLATYMNRRHSRVRSRDFLEDVFRNVRVRQCVLPRWRGRRYSVREINKLGFNAVITYMRQRRLVNNNYLPRRYGQRSRRQSHPLRCL